MAYTILRFTLILALGILLALAGYKASKKSKAAGGALAAAGFVAILFHYADPRWSLDEVVWLPGGLWRDLLYAPGALLVGAALGLAHEKPRQRVLTALLALGYAGFVLHDPLYVLVNAPGNLEPGTMKEGTVLQRNGVGCVPASTATVLRLWGVDTHDGELALRAQTSYYGTSNHRIIAAVDAIDPDVSYGGDQRPGEGVATPGILRTIEDLVGVRAEQQVDQVGIGGIGQDALALADGRG